MRGKVHIGAVVTVLLVVCGAVGFGGWDGDPAPANPCNWPDYCDAPSARMMLEEILMWAEEDHATGRMDTAVYAGISDNVFRSLDPDLTNLFGVHVCKVVEPEPCANLQSIHADALDAREEGDPSTAGKMWQAVKDEFEHFPSGRG